MQGSTRYWLPVILLCAAIFIQSSFPSPEQVSAFDFLDKLLHALVYGLLGALIYRALNAQPRWRGRRAALFWASAAAAFLYGLSDEWHQSLVPSRHADAADLVADAVGGMIGCAIASLKLTR